MTDNGLVLDEITPHSVKRIHLVGVAGTGMGSFAGMLKAAGYDVTGSDANVYPPMSDMLRAWGIDAMTPYSAENLDRDEIARALPAELLLFSDRAHDVESRDPADANVISGMVSVR